MHGNFPVIGMWHSFVYLDKRPISSLVSNFLKTWIHPRINVLSVAYLVLVSMFTDHRQTLNCRLINFRGHQAKGKICWTKFNPKIRMNMDWNIPKQHKSTLARLTWMKVIFFNNYSDVDFALHWMDFLVRDPLMSMHPILILKRWQLGRYVFMWQC